VNYIGSKHSLLLFLEQVYRKVSEGDERVACDIFAGTGAVGRRFKQLGLRVIANDLQYYSYALNRAYIGLNETPAFDGLRTTFPEAFARPKSLLGGDEEDVLSFINSLPGVEGFLARNYSPKGDRQFYTIENAEKADAIRLALEEWKQSRLITEDEYFYVLCSLIEAIDAVANTASVYGAYLKKFKASALKPLQLRPLALTNHVTGCEVFNTDSNELIETIECDVLYIDPPYNHRQYGANYHVLETIAKYDEPSLVGRTGMREYPRSRYCQRKAVKEAFTHLVGKARTRHILVSYNDEGLMSIDDICQALSLRGNPTTFTMPYNRYKADNGREYKRDATLEYVHYVRVTK
jgi:adenine-specific DNA-methyltransferase